MKPAILFIILALFIQSTNAVTSLTGSGTSSGPYLISTVDDLKFLRDQVNLSTNENEETTSIYQKAGVYYKLTANIDLSAEDWTPIGNTNTVYRSFRGVFDGNGFSISNLKIGNSTTRSTLTCAGFFGFAKNATLKNLTFVNAQVYVGLSTGIAQNAILVGNANTTIIDNCQLSGTVNTVNIGGLQIGGVIGNAADVTLVNSYANITVRGESTKNTGTAIAVNCGGFIGVASKSALGTSVNNCYSAGSIEAISPMPSGTGNFVYVGGIVANIAAGDATYQNKTLNCYSACTITSTNSGTATNYTGGIAGSNGHYNTISNCIALNPSITFTSNGTIKSANRILGYNSATSTVLSNNYALESMTITGYTPTSNITGKDGADLGANVPATLLNNYLSTQTGVTVGTNIYIYKPWVTGSTPTYGTGTSLNSSNLPACTSCDVFVPAEATLNNDAVKTFNTVTLAPNAKLTISSALTATSGITLQSDATGTATLLGDGALTGNLIAQQYLATTRNWYVSSPVSNGIAPSGYSYYQRDEAGSSWTSQPFVAGNTFVAGKGYIALPGSAASALTFSGSLNTGDVTIPLTWSGASAKGFNLIGNPYPSHLTWTKVFAESTTTPSGGTAPATLIEPSIYIRSNSGGTSNSTGTWSFHTYNATSGAAVPSHSLLAGGIIPPMQAFWIRAKVAGNLVLNSDLTKSHQTSNPLKAPVVKNTNRQLIRLEVSNGTRTDETLLLFDANAADGYDSYDSPKFAEANSELQIYSTVGTEKLVMNGMKELPLNQEIALGFVPGNETLFTLKANEITNLPSDVRVILKDYANNGNETDLTDGSTSYQFSNVETTTNRFSLIFRAPGNATGIDNTEKGIVQVFVNAANQITIIAKPNSNYSIYNTVGQLIENGILNSEMQTVNCKLQTGIYVVKINNQSTRVKIK